MHLVVGATGRVGSQVCHQLSAAGEPSRALIRTTSDPTKVERLKCLGVNIIAGDLREPDTLKAACKGINTVIATASSMPFAYQPGKNTPKTTDQDGYLSLVSAAKERGVQHFVYISFPQMTGSFPLQDAKRIVEQYLSTSGLNYTILQPTYFTEIWLSPLVGFDFLNHKATIYGKGENPISWISFLDVAQFAIACLNNPAVSNAKLELGGPEAISPQGVVNLFEKISGKPFEVSLIAKDVLQDQFTRASNPMRKSLAGLKLNYATCKPVDMTTTLKAFPLKLKSVEGYVKSVMEKTLTGTFWGHHDAQCFELYSNEETIGDCKK